MKKSRFTEPQIMAVLREAESGVAVPAVCRTHGIMHGLILQMAREVWGHGYLHEEPDEGDGRRKSATEVHVC